MIASEGIVQAIEGGANNDFGVAVSSGAFDFSFKDDNENLSMTASEGAFAIFEVTSGGLGAEVESGTVELIESDVDSSKTGTIEIASSAAVNKVSSGNFTVKTYNTVTPVSINNKFEFKALNKTSVEAIRNVDSESWASYKIGDNNGLSGDVDGLTAVSETTEVAVKAGTYIYAGGEYYWSGDLTIAKVTVTSTAALTTEASIIYELSGIETEHATVTINDGEAKVVYVTGTGVENNTTVRAIWTITSGDALTTKTAIEGALKSNHVTFTPESATVTAINIIDISKGKFFKAKYLYRSTGVAVKVSNAAIGTTDPGTPGNTPIKVTPGATTWAAVVGSGDASAFNSNTDAFHTTYSGVAQDIYEIINAATTASITRANDLEKYVTTTRIAISPAKVTYAAAYTPFNNYRDGNSEYTTTQAVLLAAEGATSGALIKNAGYYDVTVCALYNVKVGNTVTRYYNVKIVVDQAKLDVKAPTDTVSPGTLSYNHVVSTSIKGEGSDIVRGTYTYSANDNGKKLNSPSQGETWGNDQGVVNAATPVLKNLAWEFNINHGDYGLKDMNNYLCQNDGEVGSVFEDGKTVAGKTITAGKNAYYSGNDGILRLKGYGDITTAETTVVVTAFHEPNQKITTSAVTNATQTAIESLASTTFATNTTITSVYGEYIGIAAKITESGLGYRVAVGDFVSGTTGSNIKVGSAAFASAASIVSETAVGIYDKVVKNDKYVGDLYIIRVIDENGKVVVSRRIVTTESGVSELTVRKYFSNLDAGTYTAEVGYVGLYYTMDSTEEAREAAWNGQEEFNVVVGKTSFGIKVEPRNIGYFEMKDFNKIYDGTTAIVKDKVENGDVVSAGAYKVTYKDHVTTPSQFRKEAKSLSNFVKPERAKTDLVVTFTGEYGSAAAATGKAVTISAVSLAGASAKNYNFVNTTASAVTGTVSAAQMHVTHAAVATVECGSTKPMHEVLGVSVTAYMPVNGATTGAFTSQYLVEKDDAKTSASAFTTNASEYDYDATYKLILDEHSTFVIKHEAAQGYAKHDSGFEINSSTGAVEVSGVAIQSTNDVNVSELPQVTMKVTHTSNFKVVTNDDTTYADYNLCVVSPEALTVAHNIRYRVLRNSNSFDVILPINTIENRLTDSAFINEVGHISLDNGSEHYEYVRIAENYPDTYFMVNVPQDSYLADLAVVALNSSATDAKKMSVSFSALVAAAKGTATTGVVREGSFASGTAMTSGSYSNTVEIQVGTNSAIYVQLVKVNDKSFGEAYFKTNGTGYTNTKLADANAQRGGSTYEFKFQSGESARGLNKNIVFVPIVEKFDGKLLDKTTVGGINSVTVEKMFETTAAAVITSQGAVDNSIYVNYKTLFDTTYHTPDDLATKASITATSAAFEGELTWTLGQNSKDAYNSFEIKKADNAKLFNKETLIPGTVVNFTVNVWRDGVVASQQAIDTTTGDAFDSVSFQWTVTLDDYYRLFKGDVVTLRKTSAMEANGNVETAQKVDNIYGFMLTTDSALTSAKVVYPTTGGVWTTASAFNVLTNFADTWYKLANTTTTRAVVDASTKKLSGAALGANYYPTSEYAKLVVNSSVNGAVKTTYDAFARVIFGQIDLAEAYITRNASAPVNDVQCLASYSGLTKTSYGAFDVADLYDFLGWYKNASATSESNVTYGGILKNVAPGETYTAKSAVNYVTVKQNGNPVKYIVVPSEGAVITLSAVTNYTDTMPEFKKLNATNSSLYNLNTLAKSGNGWSFDGIYKNNDKIASTTTTVKAIGNDVLNVKSNYSAPVGGGGGGGAIATYTVTAGTGVSASKTNAAEGVKITLTVASGYENVVVKDAKGNTVAVSGNTFTMPASNVTVSVSKVVVDGACAKDDSCTLHSFSDLDINEWYHDGIEYCVKNGLMSGLPGGIFGPNGVTSRAQVVTIMYRMAGSPTVTKAASYGDVPAGEYYSNAVAWAEANGVVTGYSDGGFHPNAAVTREQLAAILYRYAVANGYDVTATKDITTFNDASDVANYAADAMKWACGAGILAGSNNNLNPAGTAVRSQAATMFMRFCENVVK